MDNFEFKTDDLKWSTVENNICFHCRLYDVNTSQMPITFKIGERYEVLISAKNGTVSCNVTAYETPNAERNKYLFSVSGVNITLKR